MTYNQFDQFEGYTENTLPDDERQALEQELADNATLRADLDEYRQFRHSLESITLKQQLEQVHTRLDRQGALTSRPMPGSLMRPRRLRSAWVVGALTGLMIAGLGLYWLIPPTPATPPTLAEQTFLTYYRPEPKARDLTNCGPELDPGRSAYRAANYQQALADFEKLPLNQPCVRYYRGIAQLALTNAPVAIIELQEAVAQRLATPDLTNQKAEWYLALAYLKANRPADARRQLRTIASQPGHPFQQVAQKALTDADHTL